MSETFSLVPLVNNTPLERYETEDGLLIHVKREDLCAPDPGPSFSKIRGVVAHMLARPEKVIGVLDTYHSKAGWAVAYVGRLIGKTVVNYYPHYKADLPNTLRGQQYKASTLGARLVALPAGRSAVLYHSAKRDLREAYGADSYLMPNALKLPESVTENEREARRTVWPGDRGMLVISVSSGTVAAGILRGMPEDWTAILHLGYSRSHATLRAYLDECGVRRDYTLVDEGYDYADAATGIETPFPCNPYYDLKTWKWLLEQPSSGWDRTRPIVFWNIGA